MNVKEQYSGFDSQDDTGNITQNCDYYLATDKTNTTRRKFYDNCFVVRTPQSQYKHSLTKDKKK